MSNSTLDDRLERWISVAQTPGLWKAMTKRDWASLATVLQDARIHGTTDDLKLRAAKHDVVECARKLSNLCAEFDGDLSWCSEYLDALWLAIDRMETREKELGIR